MFEIVLIAAFVFCVGFMFVAIYMHSKKHHNVEKERKIHVGKTLEVSTFSKKIKRG